jgi:hypothetical protein
MVTARTFPQITGAWTEADEAAFDLRATVLEAKAEREVYFQMGRVLRQALPEGKDRRSVTLDGLGEALASGALAAALTAALLIGGELGYEYGNARLRSLGVRPVNFPAVNPLLAEWAAHQAGTRIAGIDDTTRRLVRASYRQWLEEGGTTAQLARALRGVSGAFGRVRAKLIAVTETTAGMAWGANETYKASGVVVGLQIATSRDDRTCDICRPLEGAHVIAPLDGGFIHPGGEGGAARYAGQTFALPPLHPGCRCRLLPILA